MSEPRGFDAFELRLGDVMRGERATLGKSLLDVQRELRIKASYIAAIENCDPAAFDTPGFIAGYVRSYARYLGMDPDETFSLFCQESGFANPHGMSDKASSLKKSDRDAEVPRAAVRDPFAQPNTPFVPAGDSVLSRIEPGAIGSLLVLICLIGGIGYGGYSVLQEVQRVQLAPVEQTPVVLSDLDPLQTAVQPVVEDTDTAEAAGVFTPPRNEALDRLYRPQALDMPVLVARDAPISTLDPSTVGAFAAQSRARQLPEVGAPDDPSTRQIASADSALGDRLTLVAARPAWVRVRDAAGNVLFEEIMDAGATWQVPEDADAPQLNVGESGALYFVFQGETYGPFGPSGQGTYDLPLEPQMLVAAYGKADPQRDGDLGRVLAQLSVPRAPEGSLGNPKVLEDGAPPVVMMAVREAWVRVSAADGSVIFEATMQPGDTWTVPQTEEPSRLRVGNAGGVYFAVNGTPYGPMGASGGVESNIALSMETLTERFAVADMSTDGDLQQVVVQLNATGTAAD
ncbi:RodZ domain-containing protein [Aestuariicoccus sp. MJ-SS9]|uniref:helix-turn-helix domain-containing protein n=1 Tax=Aestuariicoccus sp. MJ-SS9 TaxID=3079855 RepID=UPI00291218EF|nr:RodZ domain-containing protein [Aestuariicoccus sp. MJ-SS9]MDU8911296.1 DUF4115 domain-containing protein [Aestuariicoccus sp. MJ-SS9]